MKYLLMLAVLSISPAMAQDLNETNMATPTCQTYVEWTGKNINEIDLSVLGDRPHRIIKPDSMVTMDYIPDRLNINVTDKDIILTQECG